MATDSWLMAQYILVGEPGKLKLALSWSKVVVLSDFVFCKYDKDRKENHEMAARIAARAKRRVREQRWELSVSLTGKTMTGNTMNIELSLLQSQHFYPPVQNRCQCEYRVSG